jgi:hypothetical protein
MSTIQNIRAIIEFNKLLQENVNPDIAIMQTHSVLYGSTALIQSGHRIVSGKVGGSPVNTPLDELLRHYETHGGSTGRDPAIVRQHDQLIKEYGGGRISRSTIVRWNYDVILTTAPF